MVGLAGYGAVYGLAFARVYVEEDSRLQAGRWIATHIPAGEPIGLEGGAYNMREVVSPDIYEHRLLGVPGLFYEESDKAQVNIRIRSRFRRRMMRHTIMVRRKGKGVNLGSLISK